MRRGSTGIRALVPIAALAVVTVLGLSACGRSGDPGAPAAADQATSDLGWEGQALAALGFSADEVTPAEEAADPGAAANAPAPSASGKVRAGQRLRHRLLKFGFGRRMLHGEAVVQTDEGTRTVVVQRGSVTAITATSVTVASTDGFTLTWTFGDKFTVVKDRTKVAPSSVAVGTTVGIAGAKDGTATMARLMVVVRT